MGSSRKAKARRKTTHTKVKASVVARCRVPHAAAATPRAVRADRRATLRRLACARSATACRCRSCCRGRRRGEPPPPLRSLRCAPLLTRTPGARARSTPWDKETTLRRNYKALGLACDPNGEHGRLNSVKRVAAAQQETEEAEEVSALRLGAAPSLLALTRAPQAEPTLGEQAQTDEEGLRVALGQHLPRGHRPPRQLTATQLVRPERIWRSWLPS
jgi:hypothetical protein